MPKSKSSTKKKVEKEEVLEEVVEEVEEEVVESEVAEEVVELEGGPIEEVFEKAPHEDVAPDPKPIKKKALGKVSGVVFNCNALRLREGANLKTGTMAIMENGSKVVVDLDNSTESFYEVTYNSSGQELIGYALKKYIEVVG